MDGFTFSIHFLVQSIIVLPIDLVIRLYESILNATLATELIKGPKG